MSSHFIIAQFYFYRRYLKIFSVPFGLSFFLLLHLPLFSLSYPEKTTPSKIAYTHFKQCVFSLYFLLYAPVISNSFMFSANFLLRTVHFPYFSYPLHCPLTNFCHAYTIFQTPFLPIHIGFTLLIYNSPAFKSIRPVPSLSALHN